MTKKIKPVLKEKFLILVFVHVRVVFFTLFECVRSLRYTTNIRFLKSVLHLKWLYLWKNPYRISKNFMKERGEERSVYGETPLCTLDRIAKRCRILSTDTVLEIGCGRGLGLLWLHTFIRCKGIGVDVNPQFIRKAKKVSDAVRFMEGNALDISFEEASVIYFYGSEALLNQLTAKLLNLKEGVRIITVSYPLGSRQPTETLSGRFPWGRAKIFCYRL